MVMSRKFIFATTDIHKVPATIISRCQRFDFKNIPTARIAAHLLQIVKDENMQADDDAREVIAKVAKRIRTNVKSSMPLLGNISDEYLETQIQEEIQINLDEVKNGFLAGSNNLFDFICSYDFGKDVNFDERVTIYCQMISQFDILFKITENYNTKEDVAFAMVYPK